MCSELNDKYFRPKSTLLLVVAILNTGDAFSADDNMPFGLAPSVDSITPPSARQNKFDVQRMFMMFINLELRICCDYEIGGTNARFVCLFELHFLFSSLMPKSGAGCMRSAIAINIQILSMDRLECSIIIRCNLENC